MSVQHRARSRRRAGAATVGPLLAILAAGCGGPTASVAAPSSPPATSPAASAAASPTPAVESGHVDVGGHKLYYACFGAGSPTVILEHGLGGDLGQWADVVPAISGRTRVCGYDRANTRGSDSVEGHRTVADAVTDLHAFLGKTAAPGPYVFVGFSWGGLVDQLYARTHPENVLGLVLVDSNSADEAETYWKHLTPAQIAADKEETAGPNPESVDILGSYELVQAAPPMPDVPLVVISSTVADPNMWPPGWDATTFDRLRADLQADLVHLTSKGRQVMAEGAGHDIPAERPAVISAAILEILDAVGQP